MNLKGVLYRFEASTLVPAPRSKVFPFFSDPRNLEKLTPDFLRFRIVTQLDGRTHEGQLIDYSLRLHGLPLGWRTLITRWDPPRGFVDVAVSSPFAFWHHTHKFEARGSKTLMTDTVLYRLPFPPLGDLLAGRRVRRDVEAIFSHRSRVIQELFPAR
jgi:ligand-binding SRPBCC domain-containing protein